MSPSFQLLLELQAIRRRHPDTTAVVNKMIDAMDYIQFQLDDALDRVTAEVSA